MVKFGIFFGGGGGVVFIFFIYQSNSCLQFQFRCHDFLVLRISTRQGKQAAMSRAIQHCPFLIIFAVQQGNQTLHMIIGVVVGRGLSTTCMGGLQNAADNALS